MCGRDERFNYDRSEPIRRDDTGKYIVGNGRYQTEEQAAEADYQLFVESCMEDLEEDHECLFDYCDGESGEHLVTFPAECGMDCSTPGQPADDSVAAWLRDDRVVWVADVAVLRLVLKGYGAWEDLDTADEDTIKGRILWLGACEMREERTR